MKSLLLFAALTATVAAKDFECPPNDYGWYADPDNCIRYFQCSAGVSQEFLCGTREFGLWGFNNDKELIVS